MPRGKISSDPKEWLERKLTKLRRDYDQSYSTVQRDHLFDQIKMFEALEVSRQQRQDYEDAMQMLRRFKRKYNMSIAEFCDNVRPEDINAKI